MDWYDYDPYPENAPPTRTAARQAGLSRCCSLECARTAGGVRRQRTSVRALSRSHLSHSRISTAPTHSLRTFRVRGPSPASQAESHVAGSVGVKESVLECLRGGWRSESWTKLVAPQNTGGIGHVSAVPAKCRIEIKRCRYLQNAHAEPHACGVDVSVSVLGLCQPQRGKMRQCCCAASIASCTCLQLGPAILDKCHGTNDANTASAHAQTKQVSKETHFRGKRDLLYADF